MTHSIDEEGWEEGKRRMDEWKDGGDGGLEGCECWSAHNDRENQW